MLPILQALRRLDPDIEDVVVCDSEYVSAPGGLPVPVCVVAREMQSGKLHRQFFPAEGPYVTCPFSLDKSMVFIAYMAVAEFGTFLQLGWPLPERVLDLYAENLHNSNEDSRRRAMRMKGEQGLLAAARLAGIATMTSAEKEAERNLILKGFPFAQAEQARTLDYCQADVDTTAELLEKMTPKILGLHRKNLQAALVRGSYMKSVAIMERNGIPLDVPLLERLRLRWPGILEALIEKVNEQYGFYERKPRGGYALKHIKLEKYLEAQGIKDFPRTACGRLETREETVSKMAVAYPQLKPWAQLLATLSQTRLGIAFPVGRDGRSRTSSFPFGTTSGRNAPSNKTFVFGASSWLRHLIAPAPGRALVYCDWSSQEFHVAARLSGDPNMLAVLRASDPYLEFARLAHAAPANATKGSHAEVRTKFKTLALGVLYGLSAYGLARDLHIDESEAQRLLEQHRNLFSRFWQWLDLTVSAGIEQGHMTTKLGWVRQILPTSARSNGDRKDQLKSLQNYLMQASGAELLRLAMIKATQRGLTVCAAVHDGLLLECAAEDVRQATEDMVGCMNEASRLLLGAEIPVETKAPIFHPEHFVPDKPEAVKMWILVMELLEAQEHPAPCPEFQLTPGPQVVVL